MLARAVAIRAAQKAMPLAPASEIVKKTRTKKPIVVTKVNTKRKKWTTKLVHPTYSIEPCPNCDFPEADGGYCPDCGWTVWSKK
jgi:hypothetical protein